jgi:hypothetical protein
MIFKRLNTIGHWKMESQHFHGKECHYISVGMQVKIKKNPQNPLVSQ